MTTTRITRHTLIAMVAMGIIALALVYFTHPVYAATKVTICHANSGVKEFVAITIDEGASTFPHLDSNGSPLNGHEDDFLLQGDQTSQDCFDAAHAASPSASASAESVVEVESAEQSVGFANGALPLNGSALPTILFSLILLASLGGLAYANVKSVRSRL